MLFVCLLLLGLSAQGLAQADNERDASFDFQCPEDYDGFFPHEFQCDLYWKCDGGIAELKVCGNGLVFDDYDYERENCDYPFAVNCTGREELEPPISTPNCPRLFGIFPDEAHCDTFWSCWNGEANKYQCPPGLAYDRTNRVCMWSDSVPECRVEEVGDGFQCPAVTDVLSVGTHTRHAHPDDCRKFYVCIGGSPREYGCPLGQVFQIGETEGFGRCAHPEDVPGCEDYYGDLDLDLLQRTSEFSLGSSSRRVSDDLEEDEE